MTNAIVMSVYNGEKYICIQLDSLKEQTTPPDEIIIIDDCSTDSTRELVKRFILDNPSMNIKFIENNVNKGWQRNFFDGLEMAESDVIFPCDQDDIWHSDKIEIMSSILKKHPEIMVLEGQPHKFFDDSNDIKISNFHTWIGNLLDRISNNKENCENSKKLIKKEITPLFMRRSPGCTLAVRKKFFDDVKNEWFEDMPHDQLLTNYAIITGSYYVLDYEVIEWRRHVGSASNPMNRNRNRRLQEILLEKKMINSLLTFGIGKNVNKKYIKVIEESKKWICLREEIVSKGSILSMFKILRYMKFYYLKRRVLTDIKYGVLK